MERLLNIKEITSWLPDLANIGFYKDKFGRLFPEGFNYYYYLKDLSLKDIVEYLEKMFNQKDVYLYRSITGSGGIFDDDDNYLEILYFSNFNDFDKVHKIFDEYRDTDELFFDNIWDVERNFYLFYIVETNNIYIASKSKLNEDFFNLKYKVFEVKREDYLIDMPF